jgi:ubiquinone/menaquinone biosynthesis C-methylase UbiE
MKAHGEEPVLDHSAARAYYDSFGAKQDSQGFYENPALAELIAHASFRDARSVFEFGCGTGKFASRLLDEYVPFSATYVGCDISPTMIGLAKDRLDAYGERAKVILSDGAVRFPVSDHSVDRVVSSYVLDLLSEEDIQSYFSECERVVSAQGRVCLASLTTGETLPSRAVAAVWKSIFHMRPAVVGGCRPVRLLSHVDTERWQVEHRKVVAPFGVPSEVLILAPKTLPHESEPA